MAPKQDRWGQERLFSIHPHGYQGNISPMRALLSCPPLPVAEAIQSLPTAPGVYRLFRSTPDDVKTLYVGGATNLQERVTRQAQRLQGFVDGYSVQYVIFAEDQERKRFEQYAVSQFQPRPNQSHE